MPPPPPGAPPGALAYPYPNVVTSAPAALHSCSPAVLPPFSRHFPASSHWPRLSHRSPSTCLVTFSPPPFLGESWREKKEGPGQHLHDTSSYTILITSCLPSFICTSFIICRVAGLCTFPPLPSSLTLSPVPMQLVAMAVGDNCRRRRRGRRRHRLFFFYPHSWIMSRMSRTLVKCFPYAVGTCPHAFTIGFRAVLFTSSIALAFIVASWASVWWDCHKSGYVGLDGTGRGERRSTS